jgi:hypothetical protein
MRPHVVTNETQDENPDVCLHHKRLALQSRLYGIGDKPDLPLSSNGSRRACLAHPVHGKSSVTPKVGVENDLSTRQQYLSRKQQRSQEAWKTRTDSNHHVAVWTHGLSANQPHTDTTTAKPKDFLNYLVDASRNNDSNSCNPKETVD